MSANAGISNVFEDLSGSSAGFSSNPYDTLISACENDMFLINFEKNVQTVSSVLEHYEAPSEPHGLIKPSALQTRIQARYAAHRTTRNTQQKAKLLDPSFQGLNIDPVLFRLINRTKFPDFIDPRHCLVFWARPPEALKALIGEIQQKLRALMPHLWLMPPECLHMTTLEITHSLTEQEIEELVQTLIPSIPAITDHPFTHRARLIKPMLSYDSAAIALSFVPSADENRSSSYLDTDAQNKAAVTQDDSYTYHHLRRSLYDLCSKAGVEVASRYTVPSAHLTIARFVAQDDISSEPRDSNDEAAKVQEKETAGPITVDQGKVQKLVDEIEDINAFLQAQYWPKEGGESEQLKRGGEWVVGEGKGLDCRKGTLWYGGGETIRLGKGF